MFWNKKGQKWMILKERKYLWCKEKSFGIGKSFHGYPLKMSTKGPY